MKVPGLMVNAFVNFISINLNLDKPELNIGNDKII